jgi:hypothetical protein
MEENTNRIAQSEALKAIVLKNGLDFSLIEEMVHSVRIKKLYRKGNYHHEKIRNIIDTLSDEI